VVLVSGHGSNLQAILDAIADGTLNAEVVAVVSNRGDAYALERAELADITTAFVPLKPYREAGRPREDYDRDLAELVASFEPDWVVCAGWMHILSDPFLDRFPDHVINLHPALPGEFPGKDAIGAAWEAAHRGQITRTGCMVHVVTSVLDEGAVFATAEVPVSAADSRDDIEERMHAAEHVLLVDVLRGLADRGEES
jgi:formyltetrahydrofolate-dependent phosphoribosylglycinamide formyltransferase